MLKLELFKTGAKMANNWPCEIGWFISIRCFGHTNWSMPWTPATRMNEHVSCELTGKNWNLTISVDTVGLWDASILNYWFWIRITAPAYPSAHLPMQDAMGKCIIALFLVWLIPGLSATKSLVISLFYDIALQFESVAKHVWIQRPHTSCSLCPAPLQHPPS